VALVDRARGLFEVGPAREMIDPQKLGRLYGREVRVTQIDGQTSVVIGPATNDSGPQAIAASDKGAWK
jgi:hypothetical protein